MKLIFFIIRLPFFILGFVLLTLIYLILFPFFFASHFILKPFFWLIVFVPINFFKAAFANSREVLEAYIKSSFEEWKKEVKRLFGDFMVGFNNLILWLIGKTSS